MRLPTDGVEADVDAIETRLAQPSAQHGGSSGAGEKRNQGEVNLASNKKQKIIEGAPRKESATVQVNLYTTEMLRPL